jgi:hypothetical protein
MFLPFSPTPFQKLLHSAWRKTGQHIFIETHWPEKYASEANSTMTLPVFLPVRQKKDPDRPEIAPHLDMEPGQTTIYHFLWSTKGEVEVPWLW